MKKVLIPILFFCIAQFSHAQEISLSYFLSQAKQNNDSLLNTVNLENIGELRKQMIIAQNRLPQMDALADVLVAPYFDSRKVVDITTNPSEYAYGYDVGITNGGLYAAQVRVTQQLFNRSITNNLLFQQMVRNGALALNYKEVYHNLKNNLIALYVTAYGYQLQEKLNQQLVDDLQIRLKVIGILVKNGILLQSDYLLLQVTIDQTRIIIGQFRNSLRETERQLYALSSAPIEMGINLSEPKLVIEPSSEHFFYQARFTNDSLQIEADREVFNNKYRPQVSAFADAGLNAVQIPNIYHKVGASAGLQFTLPLFDGHQRRINSQMSLIKQENIQNTLENNRTVKKNNLQSLTDQIAFQEQNLKLMKQQLKNQDVVRKLYRDKLVRGQVSVIDYLNVVQNYRSAESTRIQMQVNLWLLQNQYEYINW
ncbi:TolC family protein [Flavimarina sp. Hel_I_48]|uniref:TolC family protein n=1 Tax=Flavimarina sp. Hel_I_48 TaxID=1392488 RepID=UPI0004DF68DF|nr:TolC family protein [Flavimarina sp. Hel_I_48]